MARPYGGASGTHMFFGFLSIAAGVAWLCLLYFYEDLFVTVNGEKVPLPQTYPPWAIVLLSPKIFCGFWFFMTGAVGCAIKSRGCTEGVFVALNVLNAIIWAPVLLLLITSLFAIVMFVPELLTNYGFAGTDMTDLFNEHVWLWVFPAIGCLVGVVEFILSVVSYSIVCCCKPQSLDGGYEYQYEMK